MFSSTIKKEYKQVITLVGGRYGREDGQCEEASFNNPKCVAIYNDQVVVADTKNHRIRLIDINTREVSTHNWKDEVLFCYLYGVAVDPLSGQVFAADTHNNRILMIDNCFVGILEWEKDVKQLFLDTYVPNPIVDIILMYCNYNFKRTLSSC
jgi:DNA-binding beta-propeller fold protein YncE